MLLMHLPHCLIATVWHSNVQYIFYSIAVHISKSKSYNLLRTEIYIEDKIFDQLKHDQD